MMDRVGKKSLSTEMRHYVTIQSVTQTADNEGGFTDVWADVQSVFAAIYPMRATQVFEYKTVNVDATHIIKMSGKVSVTEKNRIKLGSRYFEILAIENYQERDFVQVLTCKEER